MIKGNVPSTVIRGAWYLPDRRQLDLLFTSGRRYVYFDVPEEGVAALRAAVSKGRYFNAHIRDGYRFREITSRAGVASRP